MFSKRRSTGFTLPEVLVTVAIVAVLAAAVVPTVINQMGKGEAGSVVSDFNALRAAITQFVTDTRKYPGDLPDLNERPDGTNDYVLGGAAGSYNAASRNAWKGPYLATTQQLVNGYNFAGFNIKGDSALVAPSSTNNYHITLGLSPQAGLFSEAGLVALDQLIDGGDGVVVPSGTCVDTNNNAETGKLTWEMTGTAGACVVTAGSVRFKLVPVGS